MSCYQMLLLNAGVARSACIRQTQCFCSVVAHDVAGAVLALLNEDAPGSVHNDKERRVYIAIQVSPPPPSRHCTRARHYVMTYPYGGETLDPKRRAEEDVSRSVR